MGTRRIFEEQKERNTRRTATGGIRRNTRAARFVGENRISKKHSCKDLHGCFFIFVNRISTLSVQFLPYFHKNKK
ncbi:MAG: hypothetical protein ACLRZ6_01265 [Lachnospiraceae bacterium]